VFRDSPDVGLAQCALFAAVLLAMPAAPLASQATGNSGGLPQSNAARAELIGALIDSVHGRSLAGATVTVSGTTRRATSGKDGRFRFDSLPAGIYTLTVLHPLLDTLGIDVNSRPITVAAGRVVAVGLSIPSRGSIGRALCPRADSESTAGLVVGRLRDADTDAPARAATVSLAYSEFRVTPKTGVSRVWHVRKATVNADGKYVICGLPSRFRGTLQATLGGAATSEVAVGLADDTLLLRSMTIGSGASANGSSSMRPLAELAGRVVSADSQPLSGAEATVTGTAGKAQTTENGEFSLHALPSGTHELVIRKLGYEPVALSVELTRREPRTVAVVLPLRAPELAAVQVKGTAESGLKRAGFLDRKAMGLGFFITPSMIDSLHPAALSDLLNAAPGIQVTTTDWGTQIQSTRSVALMKDACVNVFVDRTPWSSIMAGDLDSAFPVADVIAIEVYGGISVPSEFTVPGKTCATVVVWTRTSIGKP
jgi:hypothetical protein